MDSGIVLLYTDDRTRAQIGCGSASDDHPLVACSTLGHPWKRKGTILYYRKDPASEWEVVMDVRIERNRDTGTKISHVSLWGPSYTSGGMPVARVEP